MPMLVGLEAPPSDDACRHCGLPLGRRPVAATVDGERVRCCCYGCVLAWQVTRARGEHGDAAAILVRLGLGVFFAVNVMMISMPAYVPYVYGAESGPVDGPLFQILRELGIVLTLPVLLLLGWPILASAGESLRAGGANTDALIVLGVVAAYGLSIANTLAGRPGVYFDTAAMLLVLVTVGRYLEASAKAEASAAVQARLAPLSDGVVRVGADGGEETVTPERLAPGDLVRVAPGATFPTDGVVESGEGGVDEAAITGETWPVPKRPGSAIAGGTCNVDGVFDVRVTATVRASTVARIGDLLREALRARAPWQRTADGVARVLVPAVVALALAAGGWWGRAVGPERGVLVALAVLVVACPCALGIATPLAIWTGLVAASRRGVIVRSAPAFERAAALRAVVFDKTGTLTTATPRLVRIESGEGSAVGAAPALARAATLARAAALARRLSHPLARAIVVAAAEPAASATVTAGAAPATVIDVRNLPGLGASGRVDGVEVVLAGRRLAAERLGGVDGLGPEVEGDTLRTFVLEDGRLAAVLHFAVTPRPEAAAALRALRDLGVRVMLATGAEHASAIVPRLIPSGDARLGLLPAEKVDEVRRLRRTTGALAMVGDGVNDAPALAGSDLGIAVGGATDLTRLNADVAIVRDDLRCVPWLIAHARRVGSVARQNLLWSFAYNGVAVTLAVMGRLGPVVAAAAMVASSAAVMANTRRLAS